MNAPSPQTLDALGWPSLLEALAGRCRTPFGSESARARALLDDPEAIGESLARVEEARALGREDAELPLGGLVEVRPHLPPAAKGAILEARDLSEIASTLEAFEGCRALLAERSGTAPRLAGWAGDLPETEGLARTLRRSFEADGTISDRASRTLAEARAKVRALQSRIKDRLDRLLADESFKENLRESYFSVRNGRYVVPVVASFQSRIPGIVHNASQSGQTLFIEPEALTPMGNELAVAESLVAEEERRILRQLSGEVGEEAQPIAEGVALLARLDEVEAAARFAGLLDAHPATPEPADGTLSLQALRHPLLCLQEGMSVVPNDVLLERGTRALVISGPNAGGKTVTLTAVGLCALMTRSGLPLPAAAGSRVPLFTSIHSTVGDAQDLGQGLSTFSAHLLGLKRIAAAVEPGALILIDEIASDTDPREGAALAIAVLEDFLARGALALVTTHLEELKAIAHVDERFLNARVGYDARTMAPTYRLQLGQSGGSSAIALAERMGLPPALCERARALLDRSSGPLARAITEAEESARRATEAEQQARARTAEAVELRERLEQERAAHERETKEATRVHHETLTRELAAARDELKVLLKELRAGKSLEQAEQAQRALAEREASSRTKAQQADVDRRTAGASAPFTPAVGARAHHVGLGTDVEILELTGDGREAVVAAGAMKVRAPLSQLAPPAANKAQSRAQSRSGAQAKHFPKGKEERRAEQLSRAEETAPRSLAAADAVRCDVRGQRVDDALKRTEEALDLAIRSGESAALIVHGHGTGALRGAIRSYLESSPYVRMFRPGEANEGGDGVTIVALTD